MRLRLPGSSLRLWYATDGRGTQNARSVPLRNIAYVLGKRVAANCRVVGYNKRGWGAGQHHSPGQFGEAGSMPVPISQALTVATYVVKQKPMGRKRYPFVLMLEPLFRCNLACAGCGKIQYPPHILKKELTPEECFKAVD